MYHERRDGTRAETGDCLYQRWGEARMVVGHV